MFDSRNPALLKGRLPQMKMTSDLYERAAWCSTVTSLNRDRNFFFFFFCERPLWRLVLGSHDRKGEKKKKRKGEYRITNKVSKK